MAGYRGKHARLVSRWGRWIHELRSRSRFSPLSRAQLARQNIRAPLSTPWPMIRQPQVIALRCDNVNGALEAVEDVHLTVAFNFDGLVVVVSAMFAFSHKDFTPVNGS